MTVRGRDMTDKKKVALLILEGDPKRFDKLKPGFPKGTEIVTVDTKDEARALLPQRPEIDFIGTTTSAGLGVFKRELGIAKMEGREL